MRTPGQNSHAGRTQLPLLGDLGRWNEGGYRYGLLSGRAGTGETRIHRYELRKLTLPKDIPRHRNGQPDYPGFYFQGASAGERVASFDAAELHTAISRALTEALENGVPMEPHHTMAPSSIFTHTPERLDELRAESYRLHTLANQARHEYYASVDNPDLSPESRMRFLADSDQFSAEASAVDAQIAEAETVGTSRMKDRLSTRPELLADVLAGLAETNGPVPRDVTIAVNHVLSDLRITISGLYADCTIRAHLPVEDGVMTLGPIPFRVRQRIPENRAARSTLGTETEAAKEHLHAVAEAAFNTDRPLAAIGDSQTRTGHHQRLRVIDYLTTIGLKRASAHVALDCEVLTTRQTIWALLTDQPTPQGLDPAYVQRIHDTFITNAANLRRWYRDTGARALFTAYLRENGGHATMIDVREWLPHQGYEASSYAMLFSPSTSRSSSPLVEHMWATALRPRQAEGSSACTEACPKFCWDHNLARLRTCPHCYSNVDYHIPVPEIPTGLLCGNCLREPLPGAQAPRFPAEYLNVTGQTARERATAVNPSALAGNRLIADGKAVNGNARRWAIAAGLIVDDPAANLDDAIIDRYIIEITRGQVHHQPTIRRWARKNGYKVGHRGQMSPAVISAYRRDIAVNDPAILREWAQQNGLDPDAPDTLEAFAAVRP